MRFAIYTPNFGSFSDPRAMAELAREAEDAGWDGFFVWDHMFWNFPEIQPVGDAWTILAAMATATQRIKLGPLVTPLARYHPWVLARQAVTLDALSNGRLVLGVGIGGDWFGDYSSFGQPVDDRTHAEMLEEGLDVLSGLWSGEPFSYDGRHYHLKEARFSPTPVQQPRIPIWVAGRWPNKRPARRASRWDGIVAEGREGALKPGDVKEMVAYIRSHRTDRAAFDVTYCGETDSLDPPGEAAMLSSYADAGVTWWLENVQDQRGAPTQMRQRIRQGPPRMEDTAHL
jgi:alkanesulfonate monooxygenase SsuD/methylene tetrahydromethanopterin reductase-like flavin-dependent oxidoreductase (luciferase family)